MLKSPRSSTTGAIVRLVSCAALTLASFQAGFAQECRTGNLRIQVQDPSGKPLSGSVVHIEAAPSPAVARTTNADGVAEFDGVACGAWLVSASTDGFQAVSRNPLQVSQERGRELTLTMNYLVVTENVDVHDTAPGVAAASSSQTQTLHTEEVKNLPYRPATVADALPLVPGITRSPDGGLNIDGTGENRSAFVVNQADVTDPATGKFGQTVPVDSVETLNVLNTPFLAEYGHFTSGVVAVETRRGGEQWHAELNDPLPDFRFRSWQLRGLRDATPRGLVGGPLIPHRLYLMETLQYGLVKKSERTLPFPHNESKVESINSLTQFDYIVSMRQILTGSFHYTPQHTNFVNPEYFNPQPVTPNYAQHNYVGTAADRLGIGAGTLDSTVSIQQFDADAGSQGIADMILTPTGNRGNYFNSLHREATREQWLEVWSPAPIQRAGRHEVKLGASTTFLGNAGQRWSRPIDIQDLQGILLRRIEFTGGSPYNVADSEVAAFAQDHWSITPRLSLDAGGRVEHQNIAGSVRLAPRTGVSWVPFSSGGTVIRGGYGIFFDRVPLSIYTFASNPQRSVIDYAPDGTILGDPVNTVNILGSTVGAGSPLIHNRHAPGNFSPRSAVWNTQVEQRFSRFLRLRFVYTNSRSAGLVVLDPQTVDISQLTLLGGGRSRYQQAEVTGRFEWKNGQQLFLSYTRSRSQGHLGDFTTFLGNFPMPLIHPNLYSNLPGDVPNRFLAWGRLNLPGNAQLLPMVEYRSGFPYARVDVLGNYVGMPFSDRARFPSFFAADARLLRDFKVNPKYTLRLSVSGFNLSNHFNALSVHANTADPQYGVFFGNYHLRYRADFDVLF